MNLQRRKKLGQLLCEKSYLDESSLEFALAEQQVEYQRLGQILLRLGYVTQAQLNEALALQVGIEKVDLTDVSISPEIIMLVPAELVSKYKILPIRHEDGRLAVAMTDPFRTQIIEDLRLVTGRSVRRYYAEPAQMENSILKFYGSNVARMLDNLAPVEQRGEAELENGDYSPAKLHELAREPSLVNLVNLIVLEAIEARASDIHIEPFEHQVKIKYRIDGMLVEKAPSSKRLQAAIISRIKIMADMNIAERFVPQDGHIEFTGKNGRVDIRVSTVPTVHGESVELRLLDRTVSLIGLALTGHLVFSTLHTNDAPGAITRLIDMGVEPFLLASSLEAVLAQRLIRKICLKCKEPYKPDENLIRNLNSSIAIKPDTKLYHGAGCNECLQTGMSGRTGIFEMLRITGTLRELIAARPTTEQIIKAAPADHISMEHDGFTKVLEGITSPEEVLRVSKSIGEEE